MIVVEQEEASQEEEEEEEEEEEGRSKGKSSTLLETRRRRAREDVCKEEVCRKSCNIDDWVKHVSNSGEGGFFEQKLGERRQPGSSHVSGKCVLTTSWDTIRAHGAVYAINWHQLCQTYLHSEISSVSSFLQLCVFF